jgi:hypothetical protein
MTIGVLFGAGGLPSLNRGFGDLEIRWSGLKPAPFAHERSRRLSVPSCIRQSRSKDRLWRILLKKSFRGGDQKFLEPLMRLARGDVRDQIASSKIDHGPP